MENAIACTTNHLTTFAVIIVITVTSNSEIIWLINQIDDYQDSLLINGLIQLINKQVNNLLLV